MARLDPQLRLPLARPMIWEQLPAEHQRACRHMEADAKVSEEEGKCRAIGVMKIDDMRLEEQNGGIPDFSSCGVTVA